MKYDLFSNDWTKIALLHGEHLRSETLYIEQLHRWSLQQGRAWGVVQLGEEDLVVYGSSSEYEVAVRGCKAITPAGYIVDIDQGRPPLTLQGSNDRHGDKVPIYLGVAVEKESTNTGSSQTGALLDRPALRWRYTLAITPESTHFDWIQVGRMTRDGQRFIRDEKYIPQCVHLMSHPALSRIAAEITEAAGSALNALSSAGSIRGGSGEIATTWQTLLGVLATALAPATVLLDWEVHPRQYLERMAIVLKTYSAMLPMVDIPNSTWEQANDRIQLVLKSLGNRDVGGRQQALNPMDSRSSQIASRNPNSAVHEPNGFLIEETRPGMFWWDILDLICQAFQALALMFQGLTPTAYSAPPPVPGREGESVVRRRPTPFESVKKT